MTFSATAAAILYNDFEPVFVDINSYNLNLNFEDLKGNIQRIVLFPMAVHFGGHPCEMDKKKLGRRRKAYCYRRLCA